MVKHFTSLACLGILALSCSSKSGSDSTDGAGGTACTFGCATGGSSSGNAGNGNAGDGNGSNAGSGNGSSTTLTGGITTASDSLLASLNSTGPSAPCTGGSSELEVNPALLEFVVDVSGSMTDIQYNGTDGVSSKWQVTQAALSDAILNGLPDNTGVGILFFPNMHTIPNTNTFASPVSTCVTTSAAIPVAPLGAAGTAQRAAIAQGLSSALPAGGTPTQDAYDYGYSSGVIPAVQTYGFFTPFMVLITDGQPTIAVGCEGTGAECSPVPTAPIIADIAAAFAGSTTTPLVKTFIIGSPGSDAQSCTSQDGRPWLSAAARAGGTSLTANCVDTGPNYCHFDMTQSTNFAKDLADALNAIIKAAIPCSVTIPNPTNGGVADPTKINVIYQEDVQNGTPAQNWAVLQTTDTTCAGGTGDGWYIDPINHNMDLCPNTCKTVQSDKYGKLNVYQGCSYPIQFT